MLFPQSSDAGRPALQFAYEPVVSLAKTLTSYGMEGPESRYHSLLRPPVKSCVCQFSTCVALEPIRNLARLVQRSKWSDSVGSGRNRVRGQDPLACGTFML